MKSNKTIAKIKPTPEPKPVTIDPFKPIIVLFQAGAVFIFIFIRAVVIVVLETHGWDKSLVTIISGSFGGGFVGAIIGGTGYLLFLFKQKQQFWYGVCETGFAFANITLISLNIHETILKQGIPGLTIISAASSIYLLVRGATNIQDGARKDFYMQNSLYKRLQ